VAHVRASTGCAAAGIRLLDDEGNIPYRAHEGFDQRFYESESPLSIQSDLCMCVHVVKGEADRRLSTYTPGGSFYANSTTRFWTTVSEVEKGRTCDACTQAGYESVALVPIRLGEHILGLIHVADPRENMVPLEMVRVLEGASTGLGTAIQRVRAEQALRGAHDEHTGVPETEA
jgi:GAF domain-containing protein